MDGLKGFSEAIEAVYPKTEVTALCDPPDPQQREVRGQQEPESFYVRSEVRLPRHDSECRRTGVGRAGSEMGRAIPAGDQVLAE